MPRRANLGKLANFPAVFNATSIIECARAQSIPSPVIKYAHKPLAQCVASSSPRKPDSTTLRLGHFLRALPPEVKGRLQRLRNLTRLFLPDSDGIIQCTLATTTRLFLSHHQVQRLYGTRRGCQNESSAANRMRRHQHSYEQYYDLLVRSRSCRSSLNP
jgi:hypothetical protein